MLTRKDGRFPAHFDGKRFYNPGGGTARGWLDVLRWKLTSRPEQSAKFFHDVEPSIPPRRVEGDGLRATLVNHSTVLLQSSNWNILVDPIWAERASPFEWIGPRRRRRAGVRREDVPPIDVVLLTHDHYDHLDVATLRWLAQRGETLFIAPLGVERVLEREQIGPVEKLDWGEAAGSGETTIHCVPATHFSGRWLFDRNRTLWCGYVIETRERTIYLAGDTAFGQHFAAIREQFGRPRLAFLPVGAYEPRWFMSAVHMGPEEALRAHEILGAETSVAIHHGTFQLGDDAVDTPRRALRAAGAPESFVILENGKSVVVDGGG